MQRINNDLHIVPALWPKGQTGAVSGDIISMKNYQHCDIRIAVGASPGGTVAVTLDKSAAVAAATAELAFTKFFSSGLKLNITGKSGAFTADSDYTAGDTITGGTSNATAVVYKDMGTYLLCHSHNGTAFTDAETITGGTSGATATVDGTLYDEDIMLPRVTASATTYTFTIPAVADQVYVIPVGASDLGDGYNCLQLEMAAPSAGTVTYDATYILSGPRYAGTPMPTAIYD